MADNRRTGFTFYILAVICLIGLAYLGRGFYYRAITIHELLTENKHLKEAITNLTYEDQIGYAKVIAQEPNGGKILTTLKFIETARDDKLKTVLEKKYTIEGDIVYFEALIVKFGDKMVMDGETKALYLWRRVYSDKIAPEQGFAIEEPGAEPERYSDLLKLLPFKQKQLFWANIWDLANDPDKLKEHDIEAIYGNAVYSKLRKGLIYVFKISPAGQVYPEVVPDI
ncbi:MAG: hypothetical protein ACYS67_14180 [Planctomycetota bacterium]|jgi:hypothetical protein